MAASSLLAAWFASHCFARGAAGFSCHDFVLCPFDACNSLAAFDRNLGFLRLGACCDLLAGRGTLGLDGPPGSTDPLCCGGPLCGGGPLCSGWPPCSCRGVCGCG